eukprot:1141279-Pelagomonas_calceolata.AAC.2
MVTLGFHLQPQAGNAILDLEGYLMHPVPGPGYNLLGITQTHVSLCKKGYNIMTFSVVARPAQLFLTPL